MTTLPLTLATVRDDDLPRCLAGLGAKALNDLDDVHPLHHLAKHHVLAVQPGCLGSRQEELGVISVGTRVCHGKNS